MNWVGFQIYETLWILFWSWIRFRQQFGSDYGFVFFAWIWIHYFSQIQICESESDDLYWQNRSLERG